jgi:tetratricopeptide (TPR) repeat protein
MSPEWGQFLNALVYQQHQCQTIITSRDIPGDFTDPRYDNTEPDSELVHIETVTGVATKAGVEILRQRHLRDKIADLQWVSAKVEGHVFLLTQLAAVGKGKPGYLRKHPELVTKKAEPILREQLMRQNEASRDLLRRMCVLRVGIDCQGLTFLRLYQENDFRFEKAVRMAEPVNFTEEEIGETEAIIGQLVDSSLVQSRYDEENCEVLYDLHRVIVEFLQVDYQQELPHLMETVYKFYCTEKQVDNPQTLEDLSPVVEAEYFAFQLGNYSEAFTLLNNTLKEYLRPWGYWSLLKDLYEQLLPHVEDETECLICLQAIGIVHRDWGNWDKAEEYFHKSLVNAQDQDNKSGIASSWGLLGEIECKRGNYQQCLEIETELGDRLGIAKSICCLGDNERGRGNLELAEQFLNEALAMFHQLGDTLHIAETNYDLAKLERQRGNIDLAENYYNTAHQLFGQLGAVKDLERIQREWLSQDDS